MDGLAARLGKLAGHHLVPYDAPADGAGEADTFVSPCKTVSGIGVAQRKKEPEHVLGQRVGLRNVVGVFRFGGEPIVETTR